MTAVTAALGGKRRKDLELVRLPSCFNQSDLCLPVLL